VTVTVTVTVYVCVCVYVRGTLSFRVASDFPTYPCICTERESERVSVSECE